MLRLVNCKFDLVIENSRRLLTNSNAPLAQQYQRYTGGAYGHNVAQSSVYKYEPTTSVSCLPPKEIDWQICRVKNIETSLASHHQMIHYKDIYECYLQRLRQLYEALNSLTTSSASCVTSQSRQLFSVSFHDKTYNIDELIKSIDRNLEFSCPTNKINQCWLERESHSNTFVTSDNRHSLVSSNAEHFIFQHLKLAESSSKQLICSKSSEPNLPDKNKDLKESKGPSQDQLNAMQDHLVESFPKFLSDKHDYSIYTKDVEFSINWYPEKSYSTKGTVNYAIEIARLRLFVHLRLANIRMTLLKVTNHSEEGSIKVRWRIIGLPHSKALWKYFSTNNREAEEVEWLDGFSTFYLNGEGLITKHSLDRIVPENENVKEKPSVMEKLGIKLRMPLPT